MSLRRSSQNKRCQRCLVHKNNCYCSEIQGLELATKVGIIMYKKERWLPSNTAMLTERSLINSEIHLRGMPDQTIPPSFLDEQQYQPLFLYPDDDAAELTKEYIESFDKPINLVVPDGTWRQAKKIHSRERTISHIPKVKLSTLPKSIYPLRRQKFDYGVCTHEAIAYALGVIEGNATQVRLINDLEIMIKAHLKNRPLFEKEKKHKGQSTKRLQ